MSEEYEKDEEDEYKPRGPPPIQTPPTPPPSMPPPSMPPPSMPPPSIPPLSIPPVSMPPPSPPVYQTEPITPSGPSQAEYNVAISQVQEKDNVIGQLQNQINDANVQCADLNSKLLVKDNEITQLSTQINSLQTSIEGFQNQITHINNEKAQLLAQLPQLQNQLQQFQQENMNLQQQIGPLQSQISKLQEDISYKDRRIQELKEPKAVMPSSLAQGITSQSPTFGSSPSISTTSTPSTVSPSIDAGFGSGRRICPNCGATGFAIKEVEDKSKILSYIPKPQYAKKSICTKCGFEF